LRASLASATSLLALLLMEGQEVYAAPVITAGATITFGQAGGVAGDVLVRTSATGTDTATLTSGTATTLTFASVSGVFAGTVQSFASITVSPYSATGSYTFTPTTTGSVSTTIQITDTGSGSNSVTVTLAGTGVAPLETITTAPNLYVLVGQTAAVATLTNTGNGNLSGQGTVSNLRGSVTGGNSVFVGTVSALNSFSLGDTKSGTLAAQSSTFGYNFSPTITGVASSSVVTTFANGFNGQNAGGSVTTILTGTGVAPIQSVSSASTSNLVRVGTTVSNTITVANVGNGNLAGSGSLNNLNGSVTNAFGTGFSSVSGNQNTISLASNASATVGSTATTTLGYTYTPLSRGAASSTVSIAFSNGNAAGTNLSQSVVSTLTGTAVGPVFTSTVTNPGGTITTITPTAIANGATSTASSTIAFGNVKSYSSKTVFLDLENTTGDAGAASLTNLTIESYSISGANAGSFTISSLGPNSIITEGGHLLVPITVITAGIGSLNSTLTIFTDESVALGGIGDTFTFALTALSVPEPTSLIALGAGLAGLASVRRRRRVAQFG
jgi:PEP-CTERM motif